MNKDLTPLEALIIIVEECKKQFYKEIGYMKPLNNNEHKDDMVCGYPIQKIINNLKALEVIKNKKVDMMILLESYSLYSYNSGFGYLPQEDELTQEEYDLLKEVLL